MFSAATLSSSWTIYHLIYAVSALWFGWSLLFRRSPALSRAYLPLSILVYGFALLVFDPEPMHIAMIAGAFAVVYLVRNSGVFSGVVTLALIASFDLASFFAGHAVIAPIGFSFLLMRFQNGITAMRDDVNGEGGRFSLRRFYERNRNVLQQLFHFPLVPAGPVVLAGETVVATDREALQSYRERGALFLVLGFLKLFVLLPFLRINFETSLLLPLTWSGASGINLIQTGFYRYLTFYLDFSACADVAVGFSAVLGIAIPHNFNRPYLASSFREFWQRWNMTVVRWVSVALFRREDVFETGRSRLYLLSLPVIVACWHSLSLPIVLWGVLHALFLGIESLFEAPLGRLCERYRIIKIGRYFLTQWCIALSWTLFFWNASSG